MDPKQVSGSSGSRPGSVAHSGNRAARHGRTDYSIGEVADLSGLGTATIRAWERRYGKPQPIRLPSGHRRYSEADVRWARRCAEALACGCRASEIVPLCEAELDVRLQQAQVRGCLGPDVEKLLLHVGAHQFAELEQALADDVDHVEPATWLDGVLAPLLQGVGSCWADGTLGVRHEHRVSRIVANRLQRWIDEAPPGRRRPHVLLATPEDEQHGLGMLMAAYLCARLGLRQTVLGTGVPLAEIAAAATEEAADVVALSVSVACYRRDCEAHLRDLRRRLPSGTGLVIGGAGIAQIRRPVAGVTLLRSFQAFERWLEGAR